MARMITLKAEGVLRTLSLVFASSAALLFGLDRQTKTVMFVQKTATAKSLSALWINTVVCSVAAGYEALQLCRCLATAWFRSCSYLSEKPLTRFSFILDQVVAYATFAATMAAMQGSFFAITGNTAFQWSKLCNIYTRFCQLIGAGFMCALAACLAMALVSSLSAHHAFWPPAPPPQRAATAAVSNVEGAKASYI